MTVMVEARKYAMVRIQAGDWILPANDARTLWRIYRYEEDGSAGFTGIFWAVAKYDRPFQNAGEWIDPDFLEWSNWLTWDSGHPTRRAAIDAALRYSA